MDRFADPLPGEYVRDLPDAHYLISGVAESIQDGRLRWWDREVLSALGPSEAPGLSDERPGDHACDVVLSGQDAPRLGAPVVKLLDGDDILVGCDLEDAVRRRVDDRLPGAQVFLAELLDDLRARSRIVAQYPAPDRLLERLDYLLGEAVWVGRKRALCDQPCHFPVTSDRVLAFRPFEHYTKRGRAVGSRRNAGDRSQVAQSH